MTGVLRPLRASLARLGLVIVIGSFLAGLLGLLYPVHREMDTARYSFANYGAVVDGVFPGEVETQVVSALGSGTCLISVWLTELRGAGTTAGPTELDVMAPSCDGGLTRFPAQSLVATSNVEVRDWIDLGADAARALGVWTGSPVRVLVGGDVEAGLTVRSVYAVRSTGAAFAAMAPAAALMGLLPAGNAPGYGLALSRSGSAPAILADLGRSPARPILEAAKGYPPVIHTIAELSAYSADASATSLGLVRTIGALALLGVLLLSLRELDVYRRETGRVLWLTDQLGGDVARGAVLALAAAFLVALAAVSAGLSVARAGYVLGWVASCFPPSLDSLVRGAWLITVGALLAVCGVFAARLGRSGGRTW